MTPFVSQWSFKLFMFTITVPLVSLWANNFNLPKEGTASALGIYLGGSASVAYLAYGITLAVREVFYQIRVKRQKPAEGFNTFYAGYKLSNKQVSVSNLENHVVEILIQLGYSKKDARSIVKRALRERTFTTEQELLCHILKTN